MNPMKKLPEAEFEIMKVVWANEPPITTNIIMAQIGNARKWKLQSAIVLLMRLVERGFLRTEKPGKERTYYPLIDKQDYLEFETNYFIERVHENSFMGLVSTLYGGKALTNEDVDELLAWAKSKRK